MDIVPKELSVQSADMERLREEYHSRKARLAGSDIYSAFNQVNLFMVHSRQRETLKLLRRYGFYPLSNRRIFEMGCGNGGKLFEYILFGSQAKRLNGCDILLDSLDEARRILPSLPLSCADGQYLPYPTGSFDLVLQHTAFSSILDQRIRSKVAQELLRVLSPGGFILWYDFWLNPTNRQTHGIRPAEIRQLFPGCVVEFHKITLAPPIARRVVPVSWTLALMLENVKVFNSHYLAVIQPGE